VGNTRDALHWSGDWATHAFLANMWLEKPSTFELGNHVDMKFQPISWGKNKHHDEGANARDRGFGNYAALVRAI
jgi:hypothetical protein